MINKDLFSLFILNLITMFFLLMLLLGCKNFEPVTIQGQPDECNDFYSILKYYSVEGKDGAFVGTVYTECKNARSEIRTAIKQKKCKIEVYGEEPLDKTNYKKYSEYQECIK